MKRILVSLFFIILLLLSSSCSSNFEISSDLETLNESVSEQDSYTKITLSPEDEEVLEAIGSDMHVVSDSTYIETVNSIISNPQDLVGQVYQIEGLMTYEQVHDEKTAYVYRYLKAQNGDTVKLGIHIDNLYAFPDDGDWVKVTGIVAIKEHDGHSHIALDAVAIETPDMHGTVTLSE